MGYAPETVRQQFTGKERDAETGLDFFDTRYFSGAQGRFSSPDQPLTDQSADNPQSWNLYGYVRNNPLSNIDPTGQDCITTSNQTDSSVTVTVASGTCGSGGGAYVPGTVDMSSLSYNGTSVGYSYSPYDSGSLSGNGTLNLGSAAPSDALSPYAQDFYNQMSARRATNNGIIASFAIGDAMIAGGYGATYAGPAVWGWLTAAGAAGEAGFLRFGDKAFELVRDATGKIHGDLPEYVPKGLTREELEQAAQELKGSIETRQQLMNQLGEAGNHGLRIAKEQQLLYQIQQRLGQR